MTKKLIPGSSMQPIIVKSEQFGINTHGITNTLRGTLHGLLFLGELLFGFWVSCLISICIHNKALKTGTREIQFLLFMYVWFTSVRQEKKETWGLIKMGVFLS